MPNIDCEQIAAYDSTNNVIKIFGGADQILNDNDGQGTRGPGRPRAQYIYYNETIIYYNTTALKRGITAEDTSWTSFGDLIYYIDQNETHQDVRSLNIQTLNDKIEWSQSDINGSDFGICVDDTHNGTGNVYIVGNGNIFTCESGRSSCSVVSQQNSLDSLIDAACVYYNNMVWIFGGKMPGEAPVGTVYKCDPSTAESCTESTCM